MSASTSPPRPAVSRSGRPRTVHRCAECAAESTRWLGRCPACGAWGSLSEQALPAGPPPGPPGPEPVPIPDVAASAATRLPTGVAELDRVLGGGLVPGSVTLVGGEPGLGKSTLVLQALGGMAGAGARVLLVGAEESREQVRARAERLGALRASLYLAADTALPSVLEHVEALAPDVLAVDSIQTVADPDLPGTPGSVTQVRECAQRLVRLARDRSMPVLLVGHVTKDGALAGPRLLEHVVDTVLSVEGDRHLALRFLHALKHRFGSTEELGLLEMGPEGLADVSDPSALFLADRRPGVAGSVVAPVLEGSRPLLVEVQALVAPTRAPVPRRSVAGIDSGRLALLLAVLDRRGDVRLGAAEVYASVAGGVRVVEPGADLAVLLAVAGAHLDRPVLDGTVVLGEVGLGGEVRQVPQAARRLAEAARLGFTRAIGPLSLPPVPGLEVAAVTTVREALFAGLGPGAPGPASGPRRIPTRVS